MKKLLLISLIFTSLFSSVEWNNSRCPNYKYVEVGNFDEPYIMYNGVLKVTNGTSRYGGTTYWRYDFGSYRLYCSNSLINFGQETGINQITDVEYHQIVTGYNCNDNYTKEIDGVVYGCNPNTGELTPIENSTGLDSDNNPICADGYNLSSYLTGDVGGSTSSSDYISHYCTLESDDTDINDGSNNDDNSDDDNSDDSSNDDNSSGGGSSSGGSTGGGSSDSNSDDNSSGSNDDTSNNSDSLLTNQYLETIKEQSLEHTQSLNDIESLLNTSKQDDTKRETQLNAVNTNLSSINNSISDLKTNQDSSNQLLENINSSNKDILNNLNGFLDEISGSVSDVDNLGTNLSTNISNSDSSNDEAESQLETYVNNLTSSYDSLVTQIDEIKTIGENGFTYNPSINSIETCGTTVKGVDILGSFFSLLASIKPFISLFVHLFLIYIAIKIYMYTLSMLVRAF